MCEASSKEKGVSLCVCCFAYVCVEEVFFLLSQQTFSIINRPDFCCQQLCELEKKWVAFSEGWLNGTIGNSTFIWRKQAVGFLSLDRLTFCFFFLTNISLYFDLCSCSRLLTVCVSVCQVGLCGPCWGVGLQVPSVLPKEPPVSPGSAEPWILQQPSSTALGAAGQYVSLSPPVCAGSIYRRGASKWTSSYNMQYSNQVLEDFFK